MAQDKKPQKKVEIQKPKRGRPRKVKEIQESMNQGLPEIQAMKESITKVELAEIPKKFPETIDELQTWNKNLESRIDKLTKQIQTVDKKFKTTESELTKVEKLKDKILTERVTVENLIEQDQDKICLAENKIAKADSATYRADIPDIFRPIIKVLTGKEDEIILRGEIAKREAKISQRQSRLIEIKSNLADILIASKKYQDGLDALKSINQSYRAIRMQFGKVRREIEENLKNRKNEEDQNLILKTYLETVESLSNSTSQFLTSLDNLRLKSGVEESNFIDPDKNENN